MKAKLDKLVLPLFEQKWCSAGMLVGIITKKGTSVFRYGRIDARSKKPPTKDSIFEIGSASKAFAALLLAVLARRGTVKLKEPVEDLLPEGVRMPKAKGKAIRLIDLVTHTAGLPTDFEGASYGTLTDDKLYSLLGNIKLMSVPGEKWHYSNIGMGLLGHALGLRAGKNYEKLLKDEILLPLGMKNTGITRTKAMKSKIARPHTDEGNSVPLIDLGILPACGAMVSSTADLLAFLKANIKLSCKPLAHAMQQTARKRCAAAYGFNMGMGWWLSKDGFVVHGGNTRGSNSMIGFNRKMGTGFSLVCNTGLSVPLGTAIMEMLSGGQPKPLFLPTETAPGKEELAEYEGEYLFLGPNKALARAFSRMPRWFRRFAARMLKQFPKVVRGNLERVGCRLYAIVDGYKIRVYFHTPDKTFIKFAAPELMFEAKRRKDGRVWGVKADMYGKEMLAVKI